jgi:hypothetical protein
MVTNREYGYEQNIKDKVAGKASGQITTYELTKANRYAGDIIYSITDYDFVISVNQSNGTITSDEKFANAISAIAEKLAAQLLRYDFNEQVVKSKAEYEQAEKELMDIKKNLGLVTSSSKTIASSTPLTNPSNPTAPFISGVRKKVYLWN